MVMVRLLFLFGLILLSMKSNSQVIVGGGRPDQYLKMLKGKKVGVVANSASLVNGVNTVDTLLAMKVKVRKIFSPEHGFRVSQEAGATISDTTDARTGIPVISLYGKKKMPDAHDLEGIDIVVFDIQDVGVRFYTYISTLALVMQACAENEVPLVIFDRPNPNAFYIDGPVLQREDSSFVGMFPIPVVYGMTIGEYGQMVAGEGWLRNGVSCKLTVIPAGNYTHSTFYELPANPSPNITSMNAAWLYPSVCLFEGTVISVARGTCFPFEAFGHPDLRGFTFSFVPEEIPGMSTDPPYLGKTCWGLDLRTFYTEKPKLKGRINLAWLMMTFRDMRGNPDFFTGYFDKLAGNHELRKQIMNEMPEQAIRASWQEGLEKFRKIRSKYLIYPE
jgi:uncharacterized protein YbbC (DUF1343 family)